jgi:hypothetical protein
MGLEKIDHTRNLERCRFSVDHHAAPVFHDRDDNLFNGSFSDTPLISSAIPIHGPDNRLDFVLDIYYENMTSTLP